MKYRPTLIHKPRDKKLLFVDNVLWSITFYYHNKKIIVHRVSFKI